MTILSKKYFLFIGIFFLLALETNAQKAPGYQGKKVYFQYEASPRIQWLEFDSKYVNYTENGVRDDKSIELKHNFGLHMALSKTKTLGIDFTTILGPRYFRESYDDIVNGGNTIDGLFSINAYKVGLSFKSFFRKKGYIAPLGAFFELRPFVLVGKTSFHGEYAYVPGPMNDIFTPLAIPTEITIPEFGSSFGISTFFGNQWILLDRLILNYSFGATFYTGWVNASFSDIHRASARKYISGILGDELTLDVKVGVGVLLF